MGEAGRSDYKLHSQTYMMGKTLFITIHDGSLARNILRSFVLELLLKEQDLQIGLLVPTEKESLYEKEFGSERIHVYPWSRQGERTFMEKVLSYLARNGLKTETVLTDQQTYSKKGLSFFVKRALTQIFGSSKIFHALIRWLDTFHLASLEMQTIFKRQMPDLLFATDLQNDLDLDAIAAAREGDVPVIGMIRSWDNPTSSAGLLRAIPDELVVWSPYVKRQVVDIQHIPQEIIRMVGIPQYDWYVKEEIYQTREQFLKKFGIDPAKKMILFAGIGSFLNPHEPEVAEIFSEALKTGDLPENTVVLFRPHPAFGIDKDRINALGNVVFDNTVSGYSGKERSSWEMDRDNMAHLVNSLRHADVVVTTASSVTMDAVAFGKPVVCVAFDGKTQEPYWKSVKRFYHDYTHYIEISKTKGFKIANTKEELIRDINVYLEHPEEDTEGRKRLFEEFIWKLDGHSAERLVEVILKKVP